MTSEYPESEAALESVLRNSGNVDTFFDTFYSFLSRRTDFFIECPPEGGPHGFPKGQAEGMVLDKFRKWKNLRKPVENHPDKVLLPSVGNFAKDDHRQDPETTVETVEVGQKGNNVMVKTMPSKMRSEPECDSHNGRVLEKYSWSQTIDEMDVMVPVESDIKKGKQVTVVIGVDRLKVNLVGNDEPIVDGKLTFPVKKDDCYWNLVPGEAVRIFLQKSKDRWWQALLEEEEPLEMSKIEAVRPMEDLAEEEQMKIQELCWNEERKRQGLPTSEDMKMEKILKDAWNAEGSPFKGQPYDPSLVQIGNQGSFPPPASMPQ